MERQPPGHATISSFSDERLSEAIEGLFYQFVNKLYEIGEVKYKNLFVDGTKTEAYANKYTFVRKELFETVRNGKYKPSPVHRAEIPKNDGGVRKLRYGGKSANCAFSVFPNGKTVDFSRQCQRNRGFPRSYPCAFSAGASMFRPLQKSPFRPRRRLRQPLSR